MDLRGHGKSSTENELDLSIETLCGDVLAVLKTMYGNSPPAIVLVGHSMGGSVAVHVAAKKVLPSLAGLIVVDVVEGTAMASLMHMQKILSNRMQYFPTIEKAIEWSVKGGTLRNVESARISIPSTVKYDDSKKCYVHRANLMETEQYWRGWYEGLSEKFLSSPVPKILLLAGTDRLDRALTIGQMQGKFQMVLVRHTGHAIQEDVPDEFATIVLNFISRNRIGPNGVEIEWSVKGGTLRNVESARISIPSTVKYDDSKKCYVHRANLMETEQYWRGWYEGLSEKFLSSPVPKILLLAGTDRLDRALTIGQMQGKFQMVLVRHTGHAIQEDVPDEFATIVLNFISRNRIGPNGVEKITRKQIRSSKKIYNRGGNDHVLDVRKDHVTGR
uniref:protein phosphatase methylesterase-1 n=1 Tax=Daucus carota subsp. sativus TaxID=79200 RepID=A0A164Y811_DAUCS